MFRNLADALYDVALFGFDLTSLGDHLSTNNNAMQAQGDFFESAVKDILCGVNQTNRNKRVELYEKHLCYQGAKNNPPDAMYRGGNDGDAFEIKKKDNGSGSLALNSSYPYSHLESDLSRLLEAAREAEAWTQRDIFYVVGNASETRTFGNSIWFTHGKVYAQDLKHFRNLEEDLKPAIIRAVTSNGMNSSSTNELGRINEVDLLGRTDLRIRGMWGIQSPQKVFGNLPGVGDDPNKHLVIHTIMSIPKWNDLLSGRRDEVRKFWQGSNASALITDVVVDDPNATQSQIPAKLIRLTV